MARFVSRLTLGVAIAAAFAAAVRTQNVTSVATDWPSVNYDLSANRYSPLDQITASNVSTLQQVWSFHLKPTGYTDRLREDEAIPLVIGNTMYLGSPYGAVHALDATTGAEASLHRSFSGPTQAGSTPSRRRTARSIPVLARMASSISRRRR